MRKSVCLCIRALKVLQVWPPADVIGNHPRTLQPVFTPAVPRSYMEMPQRLCNQQATEGLLWTGLNLALMSCMQHCIRVLVGSRVFLPYAATAMWFRPSLVLGFLYASNLQTNLSMPAAKGLM
jgi:hypothetical protein